MPQDTVVVALARGGLESATTWVTIGLALAVAGVLVVMVLVLLEVRRLSREWSGFLAATGTSVEPLVRHATGAARNLDQAAQAVRGEVERAAGALGGIAAGLEDAALQVRTRLADLSALLDLIQSEAEEGVLDATAKLRALRRGGGLLGGGLLERLRRDAPAAQDGSGSGTEPEDAGADAGGGAADDGVPADASVPADDSVPAENGGNTDQK